MILIAGGGIAGLSLAARLARLGLPCELVEREPVWTAIGGGITLYPNGLRALRAVGVAGEVEARGAVLERLRILDRAGRLASERPGDAWDGVGPTVMIDRQVLQAVLRKAAADVPTRLGVEIAAISSSDGDGLAAVGFSDGSQGRYSLVVGADGIRSSVRALAFGAVEPRYVGQLYWRTAARVELVDCATLQVDADRYVAVMPLGGGMSYLAWQVHAAVPFEDPQQDRIARLSARFADFAEPATSALESLRDDASLHFGPAEELAIATWHRGPVVLVGDAAHACSPTMAQGGSLAIEDAVVLAEELARHGLRRPVDRETALAAFVARRKPRVDWVRERTHLEIERLNRGASHLDERTATVREVLEREI